MKLFSRKALVAGATAAALTFSGTTSALAETPSPSSHTVATTKVNLLNGDDTPKDQKTSSAKDVKPDDITKWIGVVTAVITALGTILSFANKYFKLF